MVTEVLGVSRSIAVRSLYIILAIFCLSPFVSSAMALFLGITFSVICGNPYLEHTYTLTQRLLQLSIIGLGAGMNLAVIGQQGLHGIGYTALGILLTFIIGLLTGKFLKAETNTSLLVTIGTAICGGSAIAAVAPTIRAQPHEISVALATIFFLNASALFIFPPLGHYFGLTQTEFGFWCALAIHDTSSVVGAALQYGSHAVEIATTTKLARALWIAPVALIIGLLWNCKKQNKVAGKIKYPYFILGFILSAALVTWIPVFKPAGIFVSFVAKKTLVLTLFLIGSTFTRATIQNVGVKPFIQGTFLWVLMASLTLAAILLGWIQ